MSNNINEAISETLRWEGGYSNNAKDAGGPTNWGITIADARKYYKTTATAADVKSMPKDVAIKIYRDKYWKTTSYDCDTLEAGVDLAVFDFGVNSGPARAKKYLTLSVGGTPQETINKLCDKRLVFLKGAINTKTGEPLWPTFGKGWSNRVAGIRKKALAMASQTPSKPSTAIPVIVATVGTTGAATVAAQTGYWDYALYGLEAAAVLFVVWLGYKAYKSFKKFKETHSV